MKADDADTMAADIIREPAKKGDNMVTDGNGVLAAPVLVIDQQDFGLILRRQTEWTPSLD